MGNSISKLSTYSPLPQIVVLTPFLYPNNIGYTLWNALNIVVSLAYPTNKHMQKFNANNSAAVLWGVIAYQHTNPENFSLWLANSNIAPLIEKCVHVAPFLYYLREGYYSKPNTKLSCLSLLYELMWAWRTGKFLLDKSDIYNAARGSADWYFIWLVIAWGHFFDI